MNDVIDLMGKFPMPRGQGTVSIYRDGVITKLTISYYVYTPKQNARKGRFGRRVSSRRLCTKIYYID